MMLRLMKEDGEDGWYAFDGNTNSLWHTPYGADIARTTINGYLH